MIVKWARNTTNEKPAGRSHIGAVGSLTISVTPTPLLPSPSNGKLEDKCEAQIEIIMTAGQSPQGNP